MKGGTLRADREIRRVADERADANDPAARVVARAADAMEPASRGRLALHRVVRRAVRVPRLAEVMSNV
jgi:hypothetical protein